MSEEVLKINTMQEYAEPKRWVALPMINRNFHSVTVIDAYGNKIIIRTELTEPRKD